MRVIFLDFNGVMDSYLKMDQIDSENLMILKEVVQETGAVVVISSSVKNTYFYRGQHNSIFLSLVKCLEENGIKVYGITPLKSSREEEILSFLREHDEVSSFCILEDDYLFPKLLENEIKLPSQQDGGNGLKEVDRSLIVKILRKDEV